MKRLLAVVMGLAVLAAGLGATPAHDEDNGFTQRSLKGSFGFSVHGVALEDDEEVPFVVVGRFAFDGTGVGSGLQVLGKRAPMR